MNSFSQEFDSSACAAATWKLHMCIQTHSRWAADADRVSSTIPALEHTGSF